MSGLQDFLTPFSHLVFANRDKVIVLLAGILALVTIQLLVSRWRTERLRRDLAAAKSGGSSGGVRRYVTNAPVAEEAPVESGMLPPVKGGRSYARNLGTALQKAGITPQIYSPPSPPGWATNTNPPQPSMGQPGPPYAPQNGPWAAPAAPQGSPWGGYPAGGGRGMQAPAPNSAPFYQPQQQMPSQPMSQPIAPPPGVPGPFAPPMNSPFGQPAFPAVTSGPAAPPSFAPPATPAAPPASPSFAGPPPAAEPPAADPSGGDASRRGKPKRRRFNFNVLENLEKMVQAKIADAPTPAPPTWTPPVAGSPATWTPPVSATAPAPPAPLVPSASQPVAAAQPAPAAEATAPAEEAPTEEESLPLSFGPPVEPEAEKEAEAEKESLPLRFGPEVEAETVEAEPAEPEPATFEKEPEPEPEPEPVVAEAPEAEPEPQPEPEPEPVREARGSMRSMLFGEEAVAKHEPEAAPEPATSEPEPIAAKHPWGASTYTPEPVAEAPESEKVRPWNATPIWEPEPQTETVASTEPEEAPAVPETPAVDGGSEPSAGTVVIIEDDSTAATYYATLFRGNGYRVEVANDGVSGVDLCTRLQPQLIMLDVMMPRQNGILVLQTLRASDETKNTPVVVMSNFSEPTLIKRAIQLGALEYVIKTQVEGPALLNALPRWMNHEKAFAAAA
jgi:CheY-like chemotaxis protein